MSVEDFFQLLQKHSKEKLPLVAYKKPKGTVLNGFLQRNAEVYYAETFLESGFVFAPFDSEEKNILFPLEHSEKISASIDLDNLNFEIIEDFKSELSTQNESKRHHINLVKRAISAINDHSFKKVVLSREVIILRENTNPLELFRILLSLYPDAFVYLWFHPKVGLWMGATPETLLQVKGLNFKTMALAGTASALNTDEVNWDNKNLTEQNMVVNYLKNNLRPIVDKLNISPPKTVKAGKLFHIQSDLSGLLKSDNSNLKSLIESLHPTPAVCGLPKDKAKTFILEQENYKREYYTGFLGELNLTNSKSRNTNKRNVENSAYGVVRKSTELFVNLRCMKLNKESISIYVGGGITKESNPETEWEETINKSKTMLNVFGDLRKGD